MKKIYKKDIYIAYIMKNYILRQDRYLKKIYIY